MTENRAGRGTFGNRGAREYAAPGDQRDQHVPAGACGAVFDRPAALRDARSQVPCTRPKGHTGTHENDRGMSWGARTTTTPTRRTTPNRSTPMNVTQLRARMRQLEATHINPTPTRSGAPTAVSRPVNGPLAQARRAVTLARKVPYGGFLPSQADRGLRDLANAASELLRLADTKWGSGGPSCRQTRVYLANRVASLRSVWAVPSTTPPPSATRTCRRWRRPSATSSKPWRASTASTASPARDSPSR
ncbi:hypothetical protein ACFQ2H_21990 [Streptomyces violaceoruber]